MTTDPMDIKSIIKEYEQPYAHRFDNLVEVNQSLEMTQTAKSQTRRNRRFD